MRAGEASRRDRSSAVGCGPAIPRRGERAHPARYIRVVPPALRHMTAEELLHYSHEPYRQELIGGILHEMEPPGFEHGVVSTRIAAFVRRDRIDRVGVVSGYWPGAPDLAIEVVSPNDRFSEVEGKALEW